MEDVKAVICTSLAMKANVGKVDAHERSADLFSRLGLALGIDDDARGKPLMVGTSGQATGLGLWRGAGIRELKARVALLWRGVAVGASWRSWPDFGELIYKPMIVEMEWKDADGMILLVSSHARWRLIGTSPVGGTHTVV